MSRTLNRVVYIDQDSADRSDYVVGAIRHVERATAGQGNSRSPGVDDDQRGLRPGTVDVQVAAVGDGPSAGRADGQTDSVVQTQAVIGIDGEISG